MLSVLEVLTLRANDGPLDRIPCNFGSTLHAWGWILSVSDNRRSCKPTLLFMSEAPVTVALHSDLGRQFLGTTLRIQMRLSWSTGDPRVQSCYFCQRSGGSPVSAVTISARRQSPSGPFQNRLVYRGEGATRS